jgi:hypothetical protein
MFKLTRIDLPRRRDPRELADEIYAYFQSKRRPLRPRHLHDCLV